MGLPLVSATTRSVLVYVGMLVCVAAGGDGEAEAKGGESGRVHDAEDLVKLAVADAKW